MSLYEHVPHSWAKERQVAGPPKVADQHPDGTAIARFNARIAKGITAVVGTIWCFYVFNGIALVSLPTAIRTGNATIIVNWVSSNWIQLILLPALMVGQALSAAAADARAEATFADATATLHEAQQIQEHLAAQDTEITKLAGVYAMVTDLHARHAGAGTGGEGSPG